MPDPTPADGSTLSTTAQRIDAGADDGPFARLHGARPDQVAAAIAGHGRSLADGGPRFLVEGPLGRGSQGTVLAVRDRDCGRQVALKILHPERSHPEDISRFVHEAQVTAQLEHPGVMPVHDLGVLPDGTVYYTMKRVAGRSLADLIEEQGGRPEHRFALLELFVRLCETMAFAHSRGVVHRDLKPRNILVGDYGEVLVCDWGLAKVHGLAAAVSTVRSAVPGDDPYATLLGTSVGTPAYMAPEQARGDQDAVGPRSDLYALGVVLYEMLAGRSPYVRGDVTRTLDQVVHGRWTPLDRLDGPALPPALRAIVHRCLALEPARRYARAEALAADVRAWLAGGAVSAHRETPLERGLRWYRRNRRASQAVLATTAIAAVLATAHLGWRRAVTAEQVAGLRAEAGAAELAGDWDRVRGLAERILALVPDDREAITAVQRSEGGRREAAAAARRRESALAAQAKAEAAERAAAAGDEAGLAAAVDLLQQAIAFAPGDADLVARLRAAAAERGRLAQAREAAARTADRAAEAERLRRLAGEAEARGDAAAAVAHLEGALLLAPRPEDPPRLTRLTALAQSQEEVRAVRTRAAAAEEEARRRRSEAAGHAASAAAALAADDLDAARAAAARAAALDPATAEALAPGLAAAEARRREARAATHLATAGVAAAAAEAAGRRLDLLAASAAVLARRLADGEGEDAAGVRVALAAVEAEQRDIDRVRTEHLGLQLAELHRAEVAAPGATGPRRALAAYHAARAVEAEARGLAPAAEAAAAAVRSWDDGTWADLAAGMARVAVPATAPAVRLIRLEPGPDRTLVPAGTVIEVPPGGQAVVPRGRWLAGAGPLTVALALTRGSERVLALPRCPDPPPGTAVVLAPAGPVAIARRETTCAEWLEFLNDPEVLRRQETALRDGLLILVPRAAFDAPDPLWRRNGLRGPWRLELSDGGRIDPGAPVSGISPDDAAAYAGWLAARERRPWRLPRADELAAAADPGDGRRFPWGDAADPGLCLSGHTRRGDEPWARPGAAHPADRSVHGIHDLAGSLAEFTGDPGPLRLVVGGSFLDRGADRFTTGAVRRMDPRLVAPHYGFRLACDL